MMNLGPFVGIGGPDTFPDSAASDTRPQTGFFGAANTGLDHDVVSLLTAECHIAGVRITALGAIGSDVRTFAQRADTALSSREGLALQPRVIFQGRHARLDYPDNKGDVIRNTYDWYHQKILLVSQPQPPVFP